eukprot:gene17413-20723_t
MIGAVGAAAVAFGTNGVIRTQKEKKQITTLFQERTTVKGLEEKAASGQALPPVVLVCGELASGNIMQRALGGRPTAVRQMLLTRLSPTARWEEEKKEVEKDGKKETIIIRKLVRSPKSTRYTVATVREEAPDLHLKGLEGHRANLKLPPVEDDLSRNSPTLFLTVADVLQEFFQSSELEAKTGLKVANSDIASTGSRFKHLSKFITRDEEPKGDLPAGFLRECASKMEALKPGGSRWVWHPDGYYDNGTYGTYRTVEKVSAEALILRASIAAAENNRLSPYQDENTSLYDLRDKEHAFRFVDLSIPTNEKVTVLARPVRDGGRKIMLCDPPEEVDGMKFRFRILKGHSADNLLAHRNSNENQYKSMIAIGTALAGYAAKGLVFS